ncbi:MAG: hypothetical protein OEZ34_00755 [Spirochaetia bacterium]|nr:hypothetical protein [Spirochaetia bacterium]
MTPGGWFIMIVSVVGVSTFFGVSLYMVLTKKSAPEHIHSTFEETPDMSEEKDS